MDLEEEAEDLETGQLFAMATAVALVYVAEKIGLIKIQDYFVSRHEKRIHEKTYENKVFQ